MNEASKTRDTFTDDEKEKFFSGTGIDIGCGKDPFMPHFARFDKHNGDANNIRHFVRQQFDCVVSFHCLEHMYNPYKTIQDWFSLVKKGGYMVIAVPDEDLYEQGVFPPSRFNRDHKWTFTIQKESSWNLFSINVVDLLKLLDNKEVIKLEVQDKGYNYKIKNIDQTALYGAMAQILFVVKKYEKGYNNTY